MRTIFVFLWVLMALNFEMSAQNSETLPQDPRITKGSLPNGITYYIVNDESKKGLADFYLLQGSGFLNEDPYEVGFSEIISDMAFRGTRNFPDNSIERYLKSLGVRPGTGVNSTVYPRYTEYRINRVPLTDNSAIDSCLLILYDWSCFVDMDDDALYEGYLSPEGRAELSAGSVAREKEYYSMFEEASDRTDEEVRSDIKAKMLKRFYYKWYRPDLQSIVIIGGIDTDAVKNKLTSMFSSVPKSRFKAEARKFNNISADEDIVVSSHHGLESVAVNMAFAVRNLEAADMQTSVSYVWDFMKEMYCSLLEKRICEQASRLMLPVYEVNVEMTKPAVGDEFFVMNVSARILPDYLMKSFAVLTDEVARLGQSGFTLGEFHVASEAYMNELNRKYVDRKKWNGFDFYEMCRNNFLYGENLSSVELKHAMMKAMKDKISLEIFNDFAENLVSLDFCRINVLVPENTEETVNKAELQRIYDESWNKEMFSYLDREYTAPKVDNLISVVRGGVDENLKLIKYESVEPVTGANVIHLNNGVSIIYLKNDLSEDRLMFKAIKKGGASLWDGTDADYKVLNDLVDIGGVSNLNRLDLSRYMEMRGFLIKTSILPDAVMLDGYAPLARVDEFLRLLKTWMTNRRIDDLEFYNYCNIKNSEYESSWKSVLAELEKTEAEMMYVAPDLYQPLTPAELEVLNYSKIADFYKTEIGTLSGYQFFFVGNMDIKTFKNHILNYFSEDSQAGERKTVERPLDFRWKDSVYVMPNSESIGRSVIDIDYVSRVEYSLQTVLYSYIFRMFLETIVEDAQVTLDFRNYPSSAVILRICMDAPEHTAEETYAKICERVKYALEKGMGEEEFASVVKAVKADLVEMEKSQKYWLDVLSHLYVMNIDMHSKRNEILDEVTPEKFRSFIVKYFADGNEIAVLK